MELTIILFTLFVFGGLLTYTTAERRGRPAWRLQTHTTVPSPGGPFRVDAGPAVTELRVVAERAPPKVRMTALASIYLGQMAIPGALLGMFGVLFGGLGLVSIPGLILAVRIWTLGFKLLRRDPSAAAEARALRRFAIRLNVVACGIAVALPLLLDPDAILLTVVLLGYGAISFIHANAMGDCAELLEADARRRAEAAAPEYDPQSAPSAHPQLG